MFTSKDDYITKTQIQHLESEIHRLINEADRSVLSNTQVPNKPNLSEVDNAEMKQFLNAIRLIMSSIGIDILEPKRVLTSTKQPSPKEIIYEYKIHIARATMRIEDDKYIVLKGSTAVIKNRPSALPAIIKMRESLVTSGVLVRLDKDD